MGIAGCVCCLGAARAAEPSLSGGHASNAAHATHWSYEGAGAPERWGDLQSNFKVCGLGTSQTPIDLTGAIAGEPGALTFDYRPLPLRIVNNGHTIQVNAEPGSRCTIAGKSYELLQFHFHHPSEHLLAGQHLDLECHFVHRAADGSLAVIGVFVRPGASNAALKPVFDAMPRGEGPEIKAIGSVQPADLLPRGSSYFRYMGSLTTPPCSEGLIWTVFKDAIEASPAQIRQFASLFKNNARPVQGRNGRFLIEAR